MLFRSTLDVFSQVANYSGLQTGWMGDILKKKFNVKFNIIPDQQGMLQTRMEEGNLGDIVIFGHNDTDYQNAVKNGLLYDWEEDDLVKEYAPNVYKNMKDAMEKNRGITKVATNNKESKVYGIGNDIALSNEDHQSFFYTWDVRWDLYKQLGYPTVKSLDDFRKLPAYAMPSSLYLGNYITVFTKSNLLTYFKNSIIVLI